MTTADFVFGTANLAKELPPADFLVDAAAVASLCDVAVFQEIEGSPPGAKVKFTADERRAELDEVLSYPVWTYVGRDVECPILTNRSAFRLLPETQLPDGITANHATVQITKGRDGVSPARYLTWGVYYAVEAPTVPPVVFANTHYVSGAYSNPGQLGDDDGWRRSTWILGLAATRVALVPFRVTNLTVVLGGDFNRGADMPTLWPDQQWAVGGDSIDKIAVLPGTAKVEVLFTDWVALRSDHDLRLARLRISGQ